MSDVSPRLIRMAVEAKGVVLSVLKSVGIEDDFLVRVKPAASARRLRGHPGAWIALYRGRSQFRGWYRPIFWISADIEKIVAECEGLHACTQLTFDVVVASLLHEYGHVIWELAELRHPDLWEEVQRYVAGIGEEETFAEDFMHFCRGSKSLMEGNLEPMRQIAALYASKLEEKT